MTEPERDDGGTGRGRHSKPLARWLEERLNKRIRVRRFCYTPQEVDACAHKPGFRFMPGGRSRYNAMLAERGKK